MNQPPTSQPAPPSLDKRLKRINRLKGWRRILLIALPIVLILVVVVAQMMKVPADLDTSSEKLSDNELYLVSYQPAQEPVPVNALQTWTLQVTTPDGEPVTDAELSVEGDMPQHGHGLPTAPTVSNVGEGNYLVEGLKFQMGGWWYTQFGINSALGEDSVRFDLILE